MGIVLVLKNFDVYDTTCFCSRFIYPSTSSWSNSFFSYSDIDPIFEWRYHSIIKQGSFKTLILKYAYHLDISKKRKQSSIIENKSDQLRLNLRKENLILSL